MLYRRIIYLAFCTSAFLAGLGLAPVHATDALQIRPLLVKEKIKVAEAKKGYIDIANPTDTPVTVTTSVQAFRQIDSSGNLEFFTSKEVAAGIKTDLDEFELAPREALRMYYLVDGRKLPPGDVFATIFFTTAAKSDVTGMQESTRIGTLLVLENGTPGSRNVDIELTQIRPVQIGDGVSGKFILKNPANPDKVSGFFPEVSLQLSPMAQKVKVDGPLLMAGQSREVAFKLPNNRIGLYKLAVVAGDTEKSKWVFVATGWWRWLAPLLLVLILVAALAVRHGYKKRRRRAGRL